MSKYASASSRDEIANLSALPLRPKPLIFGKINYISDFVFCPLVGSGIHLRRSAIGHLQSVAGGTGRSRLSPYHQRPVLLGGETGGRVSKLTAHPFVQRVA